MKRKAILLLAVTLCCSCLGILVAQENPQPTSGPVAVAPEPEPAASAEQAGVDGTNGSAAPAPEVAISAEPAATPEAVRAALQANSLPLGQAAQSLIKADVTPARDAALADNLAIYLRGKLGSNPREALDRLKLEEACLLACAAAQGADPAMAGSLRAYVGERIQRSAEELGALPWGPVADARYYLTQWGNPQEGTSLLVSWAAGGEKWKTLPVSQATQLYWTLGRSEGQPARELAQKVQADLTSKLEQGDTLAAGPLPDAVAAIRVAYPDVTHSPVAVSVLTWMRALPANASQVGQLDSASVVHLQSILASRADEAAGAKLLAAWLSAKRGDVMGTISVDAAKYIFKHAAADPDTGATLVAELASSTPPDGITPEALTAQLVHAAVLSAAGAALDSVHQTSAADQLAGAFTAHLVAGQELSSDAVKLFCEAVRAAGKPDVAAQMAASWSAKRQAGDLPASLLRMRAELLTAGSATADARESLLAEVRAGLAGYESKYQEMTWAECRDYSQAMKLSGAPDDCQGLVSTWVMARQDLKGLQADELSEVLWHLQSDQAVDPAVLSNLDAELNAKLAAGYCAPADTFSFGMLKFRAKDEAGAARWVEQSCGLLVAPDRIRRLGLQDVAAICRAVESFCPANSVSLRASCAARARELLGNGATLASDYECELVGSAISDQESFFPLLETGQGDLRLDIARTLAWSYAFKGKLDVWRKFLEDRLASTGVTGDTKARWLLIRGYSELLGTADPSPARAKQWLDAAMEAAASPTMKAAIIGVTARGYAEAEQFQEGSAFLDGINDQIKGEIQASVIDGLRAEILAKRNVVIPVKIKRLHQVAAELDEIAAQADSKGDSKSGDIYRKDARCFRSQEQALVRELGQ